VEKENTYTILVGNPEGKSPVGRPRRRWENNVKYLRELGWAVWTVFMWLRIGASGHRLMVVINLVAP
jgi:hypothetical protein